MVLKLIRACETNWDPCGPSEGSSQIETLVNFFSLIISKRALKVHLFDSKRKLICSFLFRVDISDTSDPFDPSWMKMSGKISSTNVLVFCNTCTDDLCGKKFRVREYYWNPSWPLTRVFLRWKHLSHSLLIDESLFYWFYCISKTYRYGRFWISKWKGLILGSTIT